MNQIRRVALVVVASLGTTAVAMAQDKAQVERGSKVYADQKCAVCHAIGVKGNAKGTLDDVGNKLKPDDIRAWMVNPALVAYMASLKKQ